jgi:hypothetical protein
VISITGFHKSIVVNRHFCFEIPCTMRHCKHFVANACERGLAGVYTEEINSQESRLLGCLVVCLLYEYGITSQKMTFISVTAVKTSNIYRVVRNPTHIETVYS